jgi:hypothetical protein
MLISRRVSYQILSGWMNSEDYLRKMLHSGREDMSRETKNVCRILVKRCKNGKFVVKVGGV